MTLSSAIRQTHRWVSVAFTLAVVVTSVVMSQEGAEGGVYVLDEPTTGLHLADLAQLLGLLDRLVDSGKSVIVIEHHQSVMAHADWLIDLGPGAGHDGGRVVFEGTPADLVAARSTLTGEHLAEYVGASPAPRPPRKGKRS
jgi:excinuclease UvrABC ATPase subunit